MSGEKSVPAPAAKRPRVDDAEAPAETTSKTTATTPPPLAVGTVVEVKCREGIGWRGGNGGAGKIRKVNAPSLDVDGDDGGAFTYNVKYFMGGVEKNVAAKYVRLPEELKEREVVAPTNFVPENWRAARMEARKKVDELRAAKRKRKLEERKERDAAAAAASVAAEKKEKVAEAKAEGGKEPEETKKQPKEEEVAEKKTAVVAKKKEAVAVAAVASKETPKKEAGADANAAAEEAVKKQEKEVAAVPIAAPAPTTSTLSPAPKRPPRAPIGYDAVLRTVVRMSRETHADEFEMSAFLTEVAKDEDFGGDGATAAAELPRATVDAALACMEEDNRIMVAAGMIYII